MSIDDYVEEQKGYFQDRLEKLGGLRRVEAYPYSYDPTHALAEVKNEYSELEAGESGSESVRVAGRVMAKRDLGGVIFLDLQQEGTQVQIYVAKDDLPEEGFSEFQELDIGDIYGVEGTVMRTDRGELSVKAEEAMMLAKALRPLPDKHEGVKGKETKYRNRHLDLLTNEETRRVFQHRETILDSIRAELKGRDFMEVDTPVLQPVYGGANARPFVTDHHSLGQEMYLRISNELYLKQLIIGGLEKVFEFARDFRNEGIDRTHNPEFTQLEIYQAYADYTDMMDLAEDLIAVASRAVHGTTEIEYQGNYLDLTPPWRRVSMAEAVREIGGVDWENMSDDTLREKLESMEVKVKGKFTRGRALNLLFEELVEEELEQPTFVYDYPIEISPLAKRHREKEGFVERFEIFAAGQEFGNAYSELNDPLEQRRRFQQQAEERELGDVEAHPWDEDYLKAMEYGMPPTGGLGIGIDRLVALLTNQRTIKDVLLFPALKRKDG